MLLPFDLVSLDGLDLTQCHQRLRSVLKSISDKIYDVSSSLLQYHATTFSAITDSKNITFDLICDAISDIYIKSCNIFRNSSPGAINAVLGSRIGGVIWQTEAGPTRYQDL